MGWDPKVGHGEHSDGWHVLLKLLLFVLKEPKFHFNFNASLLRLVLVPLGEQGKYVVQSCLLGYTAM
jgi:hypothetical protein